MIAIGSEVTIERGLDKEEYRVQSVHSRVPKKEDFPYPTVRTECDLSMPDWPQGGNPCAKMTITTKPPGHQVSKPCRRWGDWVRELIEDIHLAILCALDERDRRDRSER